MRKQMTTIPCASFVFMSPPPPRSTLFPYTTLFRSGRSARRRTDRAERRTSDPDARPGRLEARVWKGESSRIRSEEHTSELQSQSNLVCRLLLEKKKARKRASEVNGIRPRLPRPFSC